MTNIELFEYSHDHPELLLDPYYSKNVMVIPQNADETNTLTRNNDKLIGIINDFSLLSPDCQNDLNNDNVLRMLTDVLYILDNTKNINYSPFVQYFMVHNFTYSLYQQLTYDEKIQFIHEMIIAYCKDRHSIYLSHGYSNAMLQVMCDNYSHKRNSKSAIDKVVNILESYSMTRIVHIADIETKDNYFFLPDKGQRYLFEHLIKVLNLRLEYRRIEQDKLPDIVFKRNGHYYICELKSMKECGGGQNKQLVEVAYFIKFSEDKDFVHYLIFMDGNYANIIFTSTSPKVSSQRKDILNALENNPLNYFLNTSGMINFLSEI